MFRALMVLLALFVPNRVDGPPCATGGTECTEWIGLSHGASRGLVYRSEPLGTKNDAIHRALVIIHGTTRDAEAEFRTAIAAAVLAGTLEETIVVAPRFAASNGACSDRLAPGEVNWPCEGNSWRAGGMSADRGLTSFDFADEVLRRLARKSVFPNLKAIVVAGHSAGGQFVTRYEMANQVHDTLGVQVSYVVANPSSYAYPDARRPGPLANCANYNQWPYGLQGRSGYAARSSAAQLIKQMATRATTYLLGELDVLPNVAFDGSCAAMAQGPSRLLRGQAFGATVSARFGAHHPVVLVPLCGHNARCMFTADAALPVLFPNVP